MSVSDAAKSVGPHHSAGLAPTEVHRDFPKTSEMLLRSPFTAAAFYSMQPNQKLNPHRGVHSGVLRYHLGLIIPDTEAKFVLCDMPAGVHRPDQLDQDMHACKETMRDYTFEEGNPEGEE